MGKNVAPEGVANFKQWGRRDKLVAGAKGEKFKALGRSPAAERASSGSRGQQHNKCNAPSAAHLRKPSHEYRGRDITIVDNTPAGNGLEAWRRPVQKFDPASAHANLNMMSNILRPPKGKVENMSFRVGKWEEMVRRQDERTGGRSLTDETNRQS